MIRRIATILTIGALFLVPALSSAATVSSTTAVKSYTAKVSALRNLPLEAQLLSLQKKLSSADSASLKPSILSKDDVALIASGKTYYVRVAARLSAIKPPTQTVKVQRALNQFMQKSVSQYTALAKWSKSGKAQDLDKAMAAGKLAQTAATSVVFYKDGSYTGKSEADSRGAYGIANITVVNGQIATAEFKTYLKDGTPKDENYGKTNGKIENQANYDKAQGGVNGAKTYGPKLVTVQDPNKVDAVSGATASFNEFKDAVQKALADASIMPNVA